MKSDINLLYKRKAKTYSSKKLTIIVLTIAVIVVGLYAGIALPSSALQVTKTQVAELDRQINSSATNQDDLADKIEYEATLSMRLTELNALNDSKTDISKYLDAIERSRPSSKLRVMQLSISENRMDILGIAEDDKAIATFCLRLREQNIFNRVYLTSSLTSIEENITSYVISVTLPSSLNSSTIIQIYQY